MIVLVEPESPKSSSSKDLKATKPREHTEQEHETAENTCKSNESKRCQGEYHVPEDVSDVESKEDSEGQGLLSVDALKAVRVEDRIFLIPKQDPVEHAEGHAAVDGRSEEHPNE